MPEGAWPGTSLDSEPAPLNGAHPQAFACVGKTARHGSHEGLARRSASATLFLLAGKATWTRATVTDEVFGAERY